MGPSNRRCSALVDVGRRSSMSGSSSGIVAVAMV